MGRLKLHNGSWSLSSIIQKQVDLTLNVISTFLINKFMIYCTSTISLHIVQKYYIQCIVLAQL